MTKEELKVELKKYQKCILEHYLESSTLGEVLCDDLVDEYVNIIWEERRATGNNEYA